MFIVVFRNDMGEIMRDSCVYTNHKTLMQGISKTFSPKVAEKLAEEISEHGCVEWFGTNHSVSCDEIFLYVTYVEFPDEEVKINFDKEDEEEN